MTNDPAIPERGSRTPFRQLTGDRPDTEAVVRRAAFWSILRGDALEENTLAREIGRSRADVGAAIERLVSAGRIRRDAAGRIVGSAGLSLERTRHRLILDDAERFTWCAIDAVGIPAALGISAAAETTCVHCGRGLRVDVLAGRVTTDGPYVAWDPEKVCSNVVEEYCPEANLFCEPSHLEAWRLAHGEPTGRPLSLEELEALGNDWWGDIV